MDTNRAFANLERKLSASVGHRADLQFADARRINKSTAQFLLSYTDKHPTSDDIADWFLRKFNRKVMPFTTTAKSYKAQKLVTVIGQILSITRDYEDVNKEGMKPVIQGAVYLDVPLQETWDVEEREGQKVLVRKVKDDIMALVQARKQSMLDSSSSRMTFANLANGSLTRYLRLLEKGDTVKVFCDNKVIEGEVLSVNDNNIKVKSAKGTVTVPRESVLDITGRNPKDQEAFEKKAVEYYEDAYGDRKYAEKLVK